MREKPMQPAPPPAAPRLAVVVNDDPTQLSVLAGLVGKAGLEPRTFGEAEAALVAMAAGPPPALIVTDLYMPGLDGWRFCRLLRSPEYAALNRVPILVVSATFSGEEATGIAADLGAEAFLPAPVDGPRFCEQVRAILGGEKMRNPLRVLIVEDNAPLGELLKEVFGQHGYEARAVLTFQAAVKAFATAPYDVAVLDYHLPDGLGDALLDAFREQRPECVCLMMTSDPGPELALNWMKRGAAAYLHKPFSHAYLIELCARARRERALLRVQELVEVRTRELQESEERYRTVANFNFDWEYWLLPDGRLAHVSPSCERITGYPAAEFLRDAALMIRLVHPEDRDRVAGHLSAPQQVNGAAEHDEMEFRIITRGGEERWIGHVCQQVFDPQGRYRGRRGSNRDITERKQVEKALKQSRRNFDLFFNSIADLLFVLDESGNILHVNQTVCCRLGYTESELIGQSVLTVHPADRRAEAGWIVAEMLAGRKNVCPVPVVTKSGRLIPVETRVVAGEWGGKPAVFGVTRDVSEVKQSEEKFAGAFASNSALMAITTVAEGRFVEVNEVFLRTLGFQRDEVIGRTSRDLNLLVNPEDRPAMHRQLAEAGRAQETEILIRAKGGEQHTGLFSVSLLSIGEEPHWLTTMVDITARKRAEEQIRRLTGELSVMMGTINVGVSFLRDRKVQSANIAHDRMFGYAPGETVGLSTEIFYAEPEDCARVGRDGYAMIARGEFFSTEVAMRRKDGSVFPALLTGRAIDPKNLAAGSIWQVDDITERKRAKVALLRSNRALRMVSACEQEIIHATDETRLLQSICRITVEEGGYRMAWVGVPEHDANKSVRAVARFGFDHGYIDSLQISWSDAERGRGPTGTCLRTGHLVIARNLATAPHYELWREAADRNGYRASVSLPLIDSGRTVGALMIYAAEPDVFGTDEVNLLSGLADSLAFGVTALRARGEREQAVAALHQSEERFRSVIIAMAEGVVLQSADGSIIDCNPQAERILGLTRQQMLGRTSVDPRWRTVKDDGSPFPGEEHPAMVTLRTGRSSANVVMGVHLPEGGLRWINLNSEPLMRPGAGAPYSVVTTFTDMTDRIQQQQTLRDLLKQTERDAQTKGELLREVNHRVTNNLTAVLGLMTFEQRHAQGDSGSTAAVLERLSQRIRGLLKVHRMLSQSQWAPVPVNELAGQIIRAVLNAAPWRQSAVVTIRPNAIKVSPRQAGNLAMVINELATNTVKYAGLTQDPVTIEFEAESGPEFIRLRYRDNGPGFPPEVLAKERSNIGLKLVHDLVKHSLNGSMVLTNDHGAAATLHIALEEESRT